MNERRINEIEKFEDGTIYLKYSKHEYISRYEDIKTIVTKEQFESMKYNVGG